MRVLRDLPPRAAPFIWGGAVLFWIVLLALYWQAEVALADAILLATLLVAMPGLAFAQLPMMSGTRIERLPAYWGSIATLWILGTAAWLVGTRTGGLDAIGAGPIAPLPLAVWSLVLTLAGVGTMLVFRRLALWLGATETPILRELLPRSTEEKRVFGILAIAAGVGEEVAYRGYTIPVLAPLLGVSGAALLSSAVFGVLHVYQGPLGILRTTVMGGVLAWGFLASGSLWPAVIAHTLIDIIAGLVLGERLMLPEATTGVRDNPESRPPTL